METGTERQLDSQAIISQATILGERESDYKPATQKPEELDVVRYVFNLEEGSSKDF